MCSDVPSWGPATLTGKIFEGRTTLFILEHPGETLNRMEKRQICLLAGERSVWAVTERAPGTM